MSVAKVATKIALITGASSGIGLSTAVHFASLGYHLALVGRNVDNLEAAKTKCQQHGLSSDQVLLIQSDLSKDQEPKVVIQKTMSHFSRIDVLVNSAGVLSPGSLESISMEQYDDTMNVNVRSIFQLMKEAIPHLEVTKGNIVNVSSVTGLRAFPGVVAYNMSKAALDQLTRTAALELAPKGIRVNSVNPGVVVTEAHKRGGMSNEAYEKFLEHSKTTHALGRVGTSDEVARSIAFLASEENASFLTGVTLPVDGGRSVMCPR